MINKILDIYDTWRKRKNYEKAVELSKTGFLWLHENISSYEVNPQKKHFGHDKRLAEYKKNISAWTDKYDIDINFGDSLSDFSRIQLNAYHDGIFSIGGSWSHHIEMMVKDLKDDLSVYNVKNVTVGSLGGNPMLVYYNINETIKYALQCLDTIRSCYPESRIIVYGIPPLFNIYATQNSYFFDHKMIEWTIQDKNAKFLSLKEHFGSGWLKLFPVSEWSRDGVHFNPQGASKFAQLLSDLMQ